MSRARAGCAGQFLGLDGRGDARELVRANPERHHHLFESRISRTFAEPVHANLDLPGARLHAGQRVRGGETEIVVTVRGKHVVTWHLTTDVLDQGAEVPRDAVTDGVGDVEGGGPCLDACDQDLEHEVEWRPRGVLRAELDVVCVLAGGLTPLRVSVSTCSRVIFSMCSMCCGLVEMNTWILALAESRSASQHLSTSDICVRERPAMTGADGPLPTVRGNCLHRLEVPLTGNGKPGLDVVDTEATQLLGDLELLAGVEGDPGRLLTVAQRRVEHHQVIRVSRAGRAARACCVWELGGCHLR